MAQQRNSTTCHRSPLTGALDIYTRDICGMFSQVNMCTVVKYLSAYLIPKYLLFSQHASGYSKAAEHMPVSRYAL